MARADNEVVANFLARFPGPVVIHFSKVKYCILMVPLALLCAACVGQLIVISWGLLKLGNILIVAILGLLPSLLVGVLLTVCIVKDIPRLTLDTHGLGFHWLFGVNWISWGDISNFVPCVGFVIFKNTSRPKNSLDKWSRIGSFGRHLLITGVLNLGAKDGARLLTAWRERALSQFA
jgi:hypothetical protein